MAERSNPPPHVYSSGGFERAAQRRRDAEWLAKERAAPETLVILTSGLEVLVTDGEPPRVRLMTVAELGRDLPEDALFLGLEDENALFAAGLGRSAATDGRFVELRTVGAQLPAKEAGWCAYVRGLAFWRGRHRFCGVCGGPTTATQGGHVRRCQLCDAEHFPRSDPAVIVLVTHRHPEHGERCLLGRSARFPAGIYSTLAGFVEPGEALEETVRRELFEEAGIEVVEVQYRSSQPWPFPASLMLGFRARARSDQLKIDPDELVAAAWFTRAELLDASRRTIKLPNRDSIARHLIEDWLFEPEDAATG